MGPGRRLGPPARGDAPPAPSRSRALKLSVEGRATHAGRGGHAVEIDVPQRLVFGSAHREQQTVHGAALSLDGVQVAPLLQDLDLAVHNIQRGLGVTGKRLRPATAHDRIGILPRRQRRHARVNPRAQQLIRRLEGGHQPGAIAVVEEQRLLGVAAEQPRLRFRQAGAEGCRDVLDAARHQRHQVHVAFHYEYYLLPPDRVPAPIQPVDDLPLMEDRAVGRVDVFRRLFRVR